MIENEMQLPFHGSSSLIFPSLKPDGRAFREKNSRNMHLLKFHQNPLDDVLK